MTYQAKPEKNKKNNQRRADDMRVRGVSSRNRNSSNKKNNLPQAVTPSKFNVVRTELKPILRVKQDKVTTVRAKTKKPFPISAVVMVTICTLLLMFMVVSYVQINEYTIEVASLRGELTNLVGEKKDLALALEEKNDMLEIEKYATENLGMVKADHLTKKHISLDQQDKIEVVEGEPTDDLTVVSSVMSAIADNFRGLWEYME